MELSLEGKAALITGGSRGIGREIAGAFAKAGADVMICSREAEKLRAAASEIGPQVRWRVAHAGDEEAAKDAVEGTIDEFGQLDVLVNNAATNPHFGPLLDIDSGQMAKTTDVNQRAPVSWTQYAWEGSMRKRGGVVINIASIGGFGVESNIGYYNATKAALMHLTKQMAVELAPAVRVVGIAPGVVKTDMAAALWQQHEESIARSIPRGRMGTCSDIAAAAVFLASGAADWITGTTLTVDGGQHLVPDSMSMSTHHELAEDGHVTT